MAGGLRGILTMPEDLAKKIKAKKAKIAVIGLGYVGLPLAMAFARKGFKVFGLDTDRDRIERIRQKKSYISDISSKDIVRVIQAKTLEASTNFKLLQMADVVLICVPTPLKRKYTPDISYIVRAIRLLRRYLRRGQLVILESTTYPGTTQELLQPELEKSGLKAEADFFLAFSPERIDPGNKRYPLAGIPKIVGGLSSRSSELAKLLYRTIIKNVHVVSSARAAEMTKLLENSFRIINISWINEMAMMCHKLNVDIWEVIEAAKTKPFGFMPFFPGLGVGGHCIPDDPLYLYWKARHHGFSSKFIKLAADINSSMPHYGVGRIKMILQRFQKPLKGARILIIGVTYKPNVKDLRRSPALKLIELLTAARCRVAYFDPLIPYLKINAIDLISVALTRKTLSLFDCVVIATDHAGVNYKLIRRHAKVIFDTRNVYGYISDKKVVKL